MANPVYGTDYTNLKKQVLQIAPETTAGTLATTGYKKLHAMVLDVNAEFEAEIETAKGARFPTSQVLKKDMAKAGLGGKPDFNEIDFALSSVLRVADKSGSSPAYTRLYDLENLAPVDEVRKTYSIQYGDENQAESYAGGLLNDFQLSFDREGGITQSGNMLLGALDLDTALVTAGVAEIAKAPMQSKNVDLYVADTHAGLATANKVVLPFVYVWGINGRADEYWALNSSYPGPAMYEEGEGQGYAGSLKVPAIYGMATFLDSLRDGQLVYIRVVVTGKLLTTGVYEKLQIDQCWFVQSLPTDNYKGVYAKNINLVGAQSDEVGWEKSCEVTLINGIA